MILGAQMYTLHDYTKNLTDFEESLRKISEIGYKCVQVSGTCPFNAKWLKEKLDKYGLKCVITHTSDDQLLNATEYVIDDHEIFGCDYIGLGSMPGLWNLNVSNEEVISSFMEKFMPVAEKIKQAGKYFMYHNHDLEFAKNPKTGKTLWDELIERIDPSLMGFTVDTFWVQAGGRNPAEVIRQLKGRCPVVHYKDFRVVRDGEFDDVVKDIRKRMCACGDGNLDFAEITKACEEAGTKYILVEQDDCHGEDPFVCLERSYKYLNTLGLK